MIPLPQRSNPKSQWWLYIIIIPLLLYIPVLYYLLDMIIGLVENSAWQARHFDSASAFLNWLQTNFWDFNNNTGRYKPFMEFWNGLIWKLFSSVDWVIYLSRFILLVVAISFFAAAFMRISKQADNRQGIIPILLLVYLFLFFPNIPIMRFEAVELYTILFLGLCNWAMAAMLVAKKFHAKHKALFYLGFLGLVLSKEINVAPGLFILAFWWTLTIAKGSLRQNWKGGVVLTLALLAAIIGVKIALEVSTAQATYYATNMPINERFHMNALAILSELFQYQTSVVITTVFIFLLIALVIGLAVRMARRRFNGELAFIFLLIGEFISLFLILSLSYGVTLRYWSPLIPLLAALAAFGIKFLLEAVKHQKFFYKCVAAASAIFISYFVAINYYNFLYRPTSFHSARNTEEELLTEIANLLHDGQYVQAATYDLIATDPAATFHPYEKAEELGNLLAPQTYDKYFSNSPYGRISVVPPEDVQQPYYLAIMLNKPNSIMETQAHLASQSDYGILNYAGKVAGFLQGKSPFTSRSWNVYPLGQYYWTIYAVPYNLGNYLPLLIQSAGKPIAQSVFNVHLADNSIAYIKSPCAKADVQAEFFLHYYPRRQSDLPQARRLYGFDQANFPFRTQGFLTSEGTCFAAKALPQYPIHSFCTGQYISGGSKVWENCIPLMDHSTDLSDHLSLFIQSVSEPVALSVFDVHLSDDSIVYVKNPCAKEDVQAKFFLHYFPVKESDLPQERKQHGFNNFDFQFLQHGAMFDGKCIAKAPLPSFAITSIRTGQYTNAGKIWAVEIVPSNQ